MLRIHTDHSSEATTLTIEGKLAGPAVMEVEKCWRAEIEAGPLKPIVVNLAAVSFVDADGRELLTRMRRKGARLAPRGCLMNAIVRLIESDLSEHKRLNESTAASRGQMS